MTKKKDNELCIEEKKASSIVEDADRLFSALSNQVEKFTERGLDMGTAEQELSEARKKLRSLRKVMGR